MKTLTIILLTLFSVSIYAQEAKQEFDGHKWDAPYTLPTPKDWTIERFLIPISFAPQIPYKGVEDIRFTPGWGKIQSDEYWSYAFLWYLEGEVRMDPRTMENNLKAYYTGLIGINGRNIPAEKLTTVVTSFKEVKHDKDDLKTYAGKIEMVDYMGQKPIVLNCKAHLKSCPGENKTLIFYELSPQPLSHKVWISLDNLWLDFKCKKDTPETTLIKKDSLIVVSKNPKKGFYHDYILFIPKGTPLKKKTFLLVEPNNTGKISDSIEVHRQYAIDLASVSSVGNNISTELKIPLLVPIFPRPASQPLMYTHALDRDVVLQSTPELKRLDLQLLEMISDTRNILTSLDIQVDPKFFINGFSASATFTNRFSLIHPDKIKALAIGGFNGELIFPQTEINSVKLNYPIGTNDFTTLFGNNFDLSTYQSIPQFIYMGKLDDNDAVQYDDAYSKEERKIINDNIGATVQVRYVECQKVYSKNNINAIFKTYEDVGHWTTSAVNLDVIKFFLAKMSE